MNRNKCLNRSGAAAWVGGWVVVIVRQMSWGELEGCVLGPCLNALTPGYSPHLLSALPIVGVLP